MEIAPAQVRQQLAEGACQSSTPMVYTIGHSTCSLQSLVATLSRYGVTKVVDVRSTPYSRHVPQFNADVLAKTLPAQGMSYIRMGNELGGRPTDQRMYDSSGRADYARMSRSPEFLRGISLLTDMTAVDRVALMCSEEDPNRCHRWLLVGEYLCSHGLGVHNIRTHGIDEIHSAKAEDLQANRPTQPVLF